MVSAKFTQKNFQRRPAAGLAKHPYDRIHLFCLNVLVVVYIEVYIETNDKFYRKVAFLMYTEMVNFRPKS